MSWCKTSADGAPANLAKSNVAQTERGWCWFRPVGLEPATFGPKNKDSPLENHGKAIRLVLVIISDFASCGPVRSARWLLYYPLY